MGSQADLFNRAESAQRDIFAKTKPGAYGGRRSNSLWKHMNRKEGPRTLNIRTIPCPTEGCVETTTTLMKDMCARCRFGGWWGQWKEQDA